MPGISSKNDSYAKKPRVSPEQRRAWPKTKSQNKKALCLSTRTKLSVIPSKLVSPSALQPDVWPQHAPQPCVTPSQYNNHSSGAEGQERAKKFWVFWVREGGPHPAMFRGLLARCSGCSQAVLGRLCGAGIKLEPPTCIAASQLFELLISPSPHQKI